MKLMRGSRTVLIMAVCLMCGTIAAFARKDKPSNGVYMFGVSDSFSDSTVYVTNIQALDFVHLNSKSSFLPMRSSFSYQLKNYFETKKNMPDRLCAVFFNVSKDKLDRELTKVKKNYLSQKGYKVETVADFTFEKPAGFDEAQLTPEEEKAARQKAKQEQKQLKQQQKEARKNKKNEGGEKPAPPHPAGEGPAERP